jgi:hypothetical protein
MSMPLESSPFYAFSGVFERFLPAIIYLYFLFTSLFDLL